MAEPLQGAWVEVAPQTEPVQGTSDHISVRYSHAGVAWHGSMFVSHGYFYNHKRHRPAWQSDTWRFDLRALKWERVHRAWTGDGDASTPSPRYSTSAVIDAPRGRMLMFGGDDGGHRESPNNYIFGAHFDELWAFDLERHAWSRTYKPPGAAWPAKRALHGAAIANGRMHVYGGLGISDHWAYELESGAWLKVAATSAESASDSAGEGYADAYPTGPGSRHALKLAAGGDGRGIYLFGGSRHGTKGAMRPKVFDDLWYFAETGARGGVLEGVWLRLGGGTARITPPKPGAPPPDTGNLWPGPRGHHSLITLAPESGLDVGVVLFGGAMCSPGCACYNDTWVFVPRERAFHRVQVRAPERGMLRVRGRWLTVTRAPVDSAQPRALPGRGPPVAARAGGGADHLAVPAVARVQPRRQGVLHLRRRILPPVHVRAMGSRAPPPSSLGVRAALRTQAPRPADCRAPRRGAALHGAGTTTPCPS